MKKKEWLIVIKGNKNNGQWYPFEISVVHIKNKLGQNSYGWFDENKILISSSGGCNHNSVSEFVWDRLIKIAEDLAEYLNNGNKLFYF